MESSDEEIEEMLVYVKFNSMFDKEIFQPTVNYKLIGLDTDEPVMQLGAQVFTGKWENAVGTSTFFEKDPNFKPEDPLFSEVSKTNVKYVCKVQKVLSMDRTILTKKQGNDSDDKDVNAEQSGEKITAQSDANVNEASISSIEKNVAQKLENQKTA